MKKLFTLLTMLLVGIGSSWAQTDVTPANFNSVIGDGVYIALKGAASTCDGYYFNAGSSKETTRKYDYVYQLEAASDGKYYLKKVSSGQYIGKSGNNVVLVDKVSAESFSLSFLANPDGDWGEIPQEQRSNCIRFTATSAATYINTQSGTSAAKYATGTGNWSVWLVEVYTADELYHTLNIDIDATSTHASRYTDKIGFLNDRYGDNISFDGSLNGKIYWDLTNQSFTFPIGETVTPLLGYHGWAMYGYLYIDYNNNGNFSDAGELVSQLPSNSWSGTSDKTIPNFSLTNIPGTYRARFKIDWNNTNPGGASNIATNGGVIVDVMIEVKNAYDVTYRVVDGSDNELASMTRKEYADEVITAFPSSLIKSDFYDYSDVPETTIDGTKTITITATKKASPLVKFTSDTTNPVWYRMKLKNANYPTYVANGDPNVTLPTTYDSNNISSILWSFIGNPYDGFKIICNAAKDGNGNYLVLGSGTTTGSADNGGSVHATFAAEGSQDNELWDIRRSTYISGGFFLFNEEGHALNQRSTSNLAYWTAGNDLGSTFTVKEVYVVSGTSETLSEINDYAIYSYFDILSGSTLIIDVNGFDLNKIKGTGTIKFKNVAIEGGEARDCSTLSLPYTYENCTLVINETTDDFDEDNETITIKNIPDGFTSVRLRRVDRRYVTLEVTDGSATFTDSEAKVSGPKCLYDFTFSKETLAERKIENTSVILNSGSRGSTHGLNYDWSFNSGNSYNEETGLLKAKSTPYRSMTDDNAWPDNYSVAVYANIPDIENGCLMACGSSREGKNYLALIRGTSSNEIKLVKGTDIKTHYTEIATMSAENAAVAKHLVIFTKNGSTFKVYCDGVNVATTTYDQTLGTGFQIGSVHGGVSDATGSTGIIRINDDIVTSDVRDAVEIQSIRIFEGVLTDGQMSVLMNEFPYESKGGSYSRTISAAANLGEDDAWTTGETTAHIPTPVVEDASIYNPDVTITTSADATLTVNENATFGKTTFEGSGTLTIAANEGHSLNIGGAVIIYSDVVVKFGAMDMSTSPVTKGENANLTFDFSVFNFNKVYTTTKYQLTGLIGQDDTHITATGLPEDDDNRTYVFEFDDNHYWLTVTVRAPQTVYAPSETTEIEDDMPVKLTADAENTNGLLIKGDILVISETGPITFIQSPGFCSLNIPEGVTVTVNNNGAQIANVTGSGTLNVPAATSITVASIATGTTLTGNGNVTTTTFPTTTPTTTDWRGTVELAAGGDVGNLTTIFNAWGNANSVIKLNSVTGWFESDYTVNPTLNILSDATVNINNGYSNKEPKLTKLTGAGILQQTWNPTGTTDHKLHIATLTGFTGTLKGTHQPIVVDRIVLNRKPAVGDLLIKTSDDVTLTSLVVGWQPLSAYSWATETHDEVAGIYVTAKDDVAEKRDLANAIVLQYDGYIGEGVNKYTVSLGEDKYTSMESYNDAINAWTTVDDYVLPSVAINQPTSAFYRIKAGDKYLQDARKSDSATQRTLTDEEGADEATGTLFYLNDNTFIGYQTGYGFDESVRLTQDTEHLNSMLFTESSELGKYTIQSQQGTCTSADDNEGYWGVDGSELSREDDAVSGACWTLEPATSVPVTFNSTALGYATFNSPVALIVPTDKVKAYVCKIEGNTIKMYYADQLKDGDNWVLPENTPVLLYNSDYTNTPTVNLTITSDTDEEYENNGFNKGTVAAETPDAGNYIYYALRKLKSGKVGFYQRADQTAALTGFRAWIAVSKASPARNFTIEFDGDSDPTGIVEALGLEDANVEIYDLNGRKLSEYRKGINIVNGKKVFK